MSYSPYVAPPEQKFLRYYEFTQMGFITSLTSVVDVTGAGEFHFAKAHYSETESASNAHLVLKITLDGVVRFNYEYDDSGTNVGRIAIFPVSYGDTASDIVSSNIAVSEIRSITGIDASYNLGKFIKLPFANSLKVEIYNHPYNEASSVSNNSVFYSLYE